MTQRRTESGFELPALCPPVGDPAQTPGRIGRPGEYPFTRGIHPGMYTERTWTMRQYAGFGSAAESNERYRTLLAAGGQGLSVAFDLPTQMGYDSDHPLAAGEVGRVGVAIDSIEDMRVLFAGIDLARVSTSMTINAPASVLVLLYQLVAGEQGVPAGELRGTVQNDVLKEYIARGTYIFGPAASLRLTTDTLAYCAAELPKVNPISVSGYHLAEAGASPVQEVAFTLANAIAYVQGAARAGLDVDALGERLSFFFVARSTVLEEVAKFRAARRIWARVMAERFGATSARAQMLRFHTQTAGVALTAQQPENNVVRVTLAALAAVLGGTQSLHTNGYDEALGLPTEQAARLALRTQQIIAHESDIASTVDPLGGSWAVEALTDEIESAVLDLMSQVEALGGAVAAVEQGFCQGEIERSAYRIARETEDGTRVVVGVNAFVSDDGDSGTYQPSRVDSDVERTQRERLRALRESRDAAALGAALGTLGEAAARDDVNVLVPMRTALAARATVGEVCAVLARVWGRHRPIGTF